MKINIIYLSIIIPICFTNGQILFYADPIESIILEHRLKINNQNLLIRPVFNNNNNMR